MAPGPSTHMSLIGRLQDQQDARAWSDFSHRYGELITRVSRAHGLQSADCDDVLQEVLIELTRTFASDRYDPARGRFRSYLKTIVQRAVFRRFRQNSRDKRQSLPGDERSDRARSEAAEQIWEREWRGHHLRRAMGVIEVEFSEVNRLAFNMMTINGKPARAVADSLGITVDQAYQAKSRILGRLSELVGDQVRAEG